MKGDDNLLETSIGAVVVVVRCYHKTDREFNFLKSCSYHLHFLIYRTKFDIGVMCLDNSEIISSEAIGIKDSLKETKRMPYIINCLLTELLKSWEEKELVYRKNGTEMSKIFKDKSLKKYWDKFNAIKEENYSSRRKAYLDYVSEAALRQIALPQNTKTSTEAENRIIKKEENNYIFEAYKNEEHLLCTH